jgi:phosphoglycolate phosphatase-like HAD superfamily hydrolase
MKPHPSAVECALDLLDRPAHQSVLVGESVTDIQVSRATGIRSIGFAKTQSAAANSKPPAPTQSLTSSQHWPT